MIDFVFDEVDRFIIGTIGMPGEREFYLQITKDGSNHSFALEKNQAMALADRMRELVKEIRRRGTVPLSGMERMEADDLPLNLPVENEFRLGEMSLMWVEESNQVTFEASSIEEPQDSHLVVSLNLAQTLEFIRRTERVISAGRSPCPFCGLPLNLDGHLCPRANGYRR